MGYMHPGGHQEARLAAKMQDQRIRRAAARKGYRAWKSSQRDPNSPHYEKWWIAPEGAQNADLIKGPYTADEAERWLSNA